MEIEKLDGEEDGFNGDFTKVMKTKDFIFFNLQHKYLNVFILIQCFPYLDVCTAHSEGQTPRPQIHYLRNGEQANQQKILMLSAISVHYFQNEILKDV